MNQILLTPAVNIAASGILERITDAMDERAQPKAKSKIWLTRIYYVLGLGCFLLALLLVAPLKLGLGSWIYGGDTDSVREVILWLLVICYFTIIVYGLGFIALSLAGFKKVFKRPHETIMQNVYKTAESDVEHFQFFLTQDVKDLRYALRHLKSETTYFEARASLIVGSVAKVGIFPALLAFFALTQKMVIPSNSFLQALVYAMPALYFLTFYDVPIRAKMERYAGLLELAISELDDGNKKASQRERIRVGRGVLRKKRS
jgi:hypothetical protein